MYLEPQRAKFILNLLTGNPADKKLGVEILHQDIAKQLYRRLLATAGLNHEQALDVVQDTFIRVYTTNALPNEPKALATWLTTIATNITRDKWRSDFKNQDETTRAAIEDIKIKIKEIKLRSSTEIQDKKLIALEKKLDALTNQAGSFEYDEAIYSYKDNQGISYGILHVETNVDAEIKDCIELALNKLKAISPERVVAIQLHLEGQSTTEISNILARTEKATRQFLTESRKALRKFAEPCKEWLEKR